MKNNTLRFLYFLIVLLIPLNLGKHFVSVSSYVNSKLVDYLVPAIWVQDILVICLLVLGFVSGEFKKSKEVFRMLILFLIIVLPGIIIAQNTLVSFISYLRLITYVSFAYFVAVNIVFDREYKKIVRLLAVTVLFMSLLGIAQWFKQGSVFDNYVFFGEQPYSPATFNIAHTSLLGRSKIPVYGTFRHPNTFAGFLSISLFWIYTYLFYFGKKERLLVLSLVLGFVCLLLTFSFVGIFSFLFGVVCMYLIKKYNKKAVLLLLWAGFMVTLTGFALPVVTKVPLFEKVSLNPSISRRVDLIKQSYKLVEGNTLFGVGYFNFTNQKDQYFFNQPVHNMFLLTLSELGIFAFIYFVLILLYTFFGLLKKEYGAVVVLFITFLQIVILGSFDHYIYTQHQMQLLFWLTVGLALTYTKGDAKVQN